MKRTTRFFLSSIATGCTALLISCASTQTNTQNRESMLVASGLKVITPKTAAQKQKLQNLPAGNVTMVKKGRKPITSSQIRLTIRRTSVDPKISGLSTASRRQEARERRSPGRGDVSGHDDGVEFVGGWRRSVGTHGRTGCVLKIKPTVRAHLRNQKQWYAEFLSLCPGNDVARASQPCRPSPKVLRQNLVHSQYFPPSISDAYEA